MISRSATLVAFTVAILTATAALACELHSDNAARIDTSSRPTPGKPHEPSLAEIRNATERFRDIKVALAEGYVRDPANMCETAEMMGLPKEKGAMGLHYVRMDLLGVTAPPNPRVDGVGIHTDFVKPGVLIYEPQADGSLELVAVENLVFARAWKAAGHDTPPTFHGLHYDKMADNPATPVDEAHRFEPHYDRHVWLYRENPNGIFAQFNPRVSCEHHEASAAAGGAPHSHKHTSGS